MKRVIAMLLALTMVVCLFVGCGPAKTDPAGDADAPKTTDEGTDQASADGKTEQGDKTYKVGFSNVWVGNTYGIQCVNELEAFLSRNEKISEYYIYNADNDVNKQISDIEDLIAKGVDMLILQPISAESVAPVVEEAYEKGIVVVDCTSPLADATDAYHVSVVAKDYDFGYIGAKWLCEQMN